MMKQILDYSDYITTNHAELDRDMSGINEKYGIPQIVKNIFKELLKEVDSMISYNILNKKISFNEFYKSNDNKKFNFNGDLDIKINKSNRNDIYGISSPMKIELYFNFDSYDKVELKRVLLHEILHVYEISNRMKNDSSSLQWSISKTLMSIRDKYKSDKFISDLIYNIYISFDHEIGARVCETYIVLMEFMSTDKDLLNSELKNTKAWYYKKMLTNLKTDSINYQNLLNFFIEFNGLISNKFELNNKVFRIPNDTKNCKSILKEWLSIFNKKSKYFERKLLKVIDEVILDVNMLNNTSIKENFEIVYNKELYRDYRIRKILRKDY